MIWICKSLPETHFFLLNSPQSILKRKCCHNKMCLKGRAKLNDKYWGFLWFLSLCAVSNCRYMVAGFLILPWETQGLGSLLVKDRTWHGYYHQGKILDNNLIYNGLTRSSFLRQRKKIHRERNSHLSHPFIFRKGWYET